MALTPEQTQMLQFYMQKNRNVLQPAQAAPIQLPSRSGGGGTSGASSLLSTIGGYFDTPPVQGPVQPGAAPLDTGQSWLSKFADRLDPVAANQRKLISEQLPPLQISRDQVEAFMRKAGLI